MTFRITLSQIRKDSLVCPNYEAQTWREILTNIRWYLCKISYGIFCPVRDLGYVGNFWTKMASTKFYVTPFSRVALFREDGQREDRTDGQVLRTH